MLVPIPLWFAFFTEYNYGGEYFAVIATTVYLLLKVGITGPHNLQSVAYTASVGLYETL